MIGYHSLFDGAFGDEPRRSSDDLLQELEQLLEGAIATGAAEMKLVSLNQTQQL